MQCGLLRDMLVDQEDEEEGTILPVDLPDLHTLQRVMEFLEHARAKRDGEDAFVGPAVPCEVVLATMQAANYLACESLLDTCARALATRIKGRETKDALAEFGLQPVGLEQTIQVAKNNMWLFDLPPGAGGQGAG